jgi:dihydroorotate dehydrogenase
LTIVEIIAKTEYKIRPLIVKLPPKAATAIFSAGRKAFISILANDRPIGRITIPASEQRILWNIKFNSSLFNAAGMFKHGEGYHTVSRQGAGAYLAGTTTKLKRSGNIYSGIKHPAVAFPRSAMAVNWMGLPNEGHEIVAKRLSRIDKIEGCPVGASIGSDPQQTGIDALNGIIDGFILYANANVDFIELNESCPNVEHEHSTETIDGLDKALVKRLEYISQHYIRNRGKYIPLIVKFSNDTAPELVPAIINLLVTLRFDGVNFGNTSTNYAALQKSIISSERKLYNFFTGEIGGGLSGRALKTRSFALASLAVKSLANVNPPQEFHIIRTGGIETYADIKLSEAAGISLNQWFTGYFDAFARYGHNVYAGTLK